jgi:predicted metalloprotease
VQYRTHGFKENTMRLDGSDESKNIEDRRGSHTGMGGGMFGRGGGGKKFGLGTIVLILVAHGDFAQGYVIAHEIGHHVQNRLGILDQVNEARGRGNQRQANALSVLSELQADCLAGIWANQLRRQGDIIEPGDIEEAINAAAAVGDDRLQKQQQGYVVPDAFTHGTSQQRMTWFKRGLESGNIAQCDTFASTR